MFLRNGGEKYKGVLVSGIDYCVEFNCVKIQMKQLWIGDQQSESNAEVRLFSGESEGRNVGGRGGRCEWEKGTSNGKRDVILLKNGMGLRLGTNRREPKIHRMIGKVNRTEIIILIHYGILIKHISRQEYAELRTYFTSK